jgi:hypothetical protein
MARTVPNEMGAIDDTGNRFKIDCGVAAGLNATKGLHVYLNDDNAWASVGTSFDGGKMTGIIEEPVDNSADSTTSRPVKVLLIGRFVGKVDAAVQEGAVMKRSDATAGQFEGATVASDSPFICDCYAETVGGTNSNAILFKYR